MITEALVHIKVAVDKETASQRIITKHAEEIMINTDILKGHINSVLPIEMDSKRGNGNNFTTEGNADKLIDGSVKRSISNKGNNVPILNGKIEKIDVLGAVYNTIETAGGVPVSLRKRDVMKRKKTTKASQDGNKTIQRQTSISDSLNAIKSNS